MSCLNWKRSMTMGLGGLSLSAPAAGPAAGGAPGGGGDGGVGGRGDHGLGRRVGGSVRVGVLDHPRPGSCRPGTRRSRSPSRPGPPAADPRRRRGPSATAGRRVFSSPREEMKASQRPSGLKRGVFSLSLARPVSATVRAPSQEVIQMWLKPLSAVRVGPGDGVGDPLAGGVHLRVADSRKAGDVVRRDRACGRRRAGEQAKRKYGWSQHGGGPLSAQTLAARKGPASGKMFGCGRGRCRPTERPIWGAGGLFRIRTGCRSADAPYLGA